MSRNKPLKNGRGGNALSSFIGLERYLLNSPAWRDLSSTARSAYIEVAAGYDGSNNGRIIVSTQLLGERMGCNKSTAARALQELAEHGFISCQMKGGFVCKVRHASEWRLHAFKCDVTGDLPLKPFMVWRPQIQKSVAQMQPHGGAGATVKENKPAKATPQWRGRNREGQIEPAYGGTGATLLYSNHREDATNTVDSDGTGKLKARVQHGDAIANHSDDTFQTCGAVALKSLAQLHAELPDILKSWSPISQNTS